MSLRVHEIAKDLKLTSKEILEKLKALKVDAKSHMSVLTDEDIKKLKMSLSKKAETKTEAPKAAAKPETKPAVSQTPSIESVKKEFLLQRLGSKAPSASATAAPAKKVTPSQTSSFKRPENTTLYTKPKVVETPKPAQKIIPKETVNPAVAAAAAPSARPIPVVPEPVKKIQKIELPESIVVKDLATRFQLKPTDLIMRLMKLGIFANINQAINFDVAVKVAAEIGFEVERSKGIEIQKEEAREEVKDKSKLVSRATIVTFMGHVDHGKTSLLDAIRKSKVAAGEAGGITQHIGAYEVFLPKGAVTFLDTPGHEAFTAMRARGASVTDVVVLVVAADDGVMPQTIEAIDHAKAAGVTIIVAINKIDLPSANMDRVKKALMEHGLMTEEWGGKTVMVGVSAKTGKGIDELLEMLALEAELLELKADPTADAKGVVIEAERSKESGVLATVLVQNGTLRIGDFVVVGNYYGKVRAMINDRGQRIKEALPSMPVAILGLNDVPRAGDRFEIVKDEHAAREIAEAKREKAAAEGTGMHVTLEHLYEDIKAGKVQELKLIIKSDVQGSVEALRSTLGKIQSKNVRLNIIHTGIGDITESDVMLAAASNAVVIGFHVDMVSTAKETADREGVDVRFYQIIYEVKTAIEKAMEGLLTPELSEAFVGRAEVRQVFKVSKIGMIAGCAVQKGKIVRNYSCRVIRGGAKIHDGKIESLKRFKDDAREVLEGFECGIGVSNFDELTVGDLIEVFEIQKKARKLE